MDKLDEKQSDLQATNFSFRADDIKKNPIFKKYKRIIKEMKIQKKNDRQKKKMAMLEENGGHDGKLPGGETSSDNQSSSDDTSSDDS